MRVKASQLKVGDICNGSKETVVSVKPGGIMNHGKMELLLKKQTTSMVRPAIWGKNTTIGITRN